MKYTNVDHYKIFYADKLLKIKTLRQEYYRYNKGRGKHFLSPKTRIFHYSIDKWYVLFFIPKSKAY